MVEEVQQLIVRTQHRFRFTLGKILDEHSGANLLAEELLHEIDF